jgi:hypothetical protein
MDSWEAKGRFNKRHKMFQKKFKSILLDENNHNF